MKSCASRPQCLLSLLSLLRFGVLVSCTSDKAGHSDDKANAGETSIAEPDCSAEGTSQVPEASTNIPRFEIDSWLSDVVPTVATVNFSVDLPLQQAWVEFGRTADVPEYVAPVDLRQRPFSALLLGMKEDMTYHWSIMAEGCDGQEYRSDPQQLHTGNLSLRAPGASVVDVTPGTLDEGFTLTCNGYGNAMQIEPNGESSWSLIYDKDGDLVWAYELTDSPAYGCNRARMSHDGRHLWMGNSSFARPTGALRRVEMDGSAPKDYSLPERHHDFTVLPSGHILYQRQQIVTGGTGAVEGADDIMELDPETGDSVLIYDENQDFAAEIAEVGAHTNYISYVPWLEAFSLSFLYLDMIALVSYPEGELLGVFGGARDEFGVSWDAQHGHHFTRDGLLVFNNWIEPTTSGKLEFSYDLQNKSVGPIDKYVPEAGYATVAFGDVQRLANGNTLVTFSSNGVLQEIDPNGVLLREMVVPTPIGFATRRPTLYGPPPHLLDSE